MPANDLSFQQVSTVLNSIAAQATGNSALAATDTSSFVSVAQTVLKTGYDPVINAISQVMSNTVFSQRPYSHKFKGIQVTNQQFGNMQRKLNIADKDFEDDDRITLVDGSSIDMYKVNKPNVLQTNFYGAAVFEKSTTIFKDQLDCAFTTPDEFARFISMQLQNASDQLEQARENMARATVANFIGGKVAGDSGNVIHLLTEYNAFTGQTLTAATVYLPANFENFMKWVYSRIATLSSLMTERTIKYHINVTGKNISRHTPMERQKLYMFAPSQYQTESMVLAGVYHDNYLKYANNEKVNFWQSIDTPDSINVKATYMKPDGTLTTPADAVLTEGIFGTMFDEEALGYTLVNQWQAPTPFNARGGYSNIFWHETARYWNDFTENGIVFLLD